MLLWGQVIVWNTSPRLDRPQRVVEAHDRLSSAWHPHDCLRMSARLSSAVPDP